MGLRKVAAEVLEVLPDVTYEIRLNHRGVLSAVWQYTGVPSSLRPRVAQILLWAGLPPVGSRCGNSYRQGRAQLSIVALSPHRLFHSLTVL